MTRKEYNGWTNYETWVVKLWVDNDEGSNNYWAEQADECLEQATRRHFDASEATGLLADAIKEQHETALPDVQGFAADLLNAAMSEVNWYEIAESLLNDAKERVAA